MNKNNKNKLVPRLRFPEFKNAGEWEVKRVGDVFDLTDGFPFSSSDFSDYDANSKQVIRITDINNKNKNEDKVYISIRRVKELKIEKYVVSKGDLLLSLTGAAGFNFFIWNYEEGYINQRTMKLSPKNIENKALIILLEPLIHKKINAIGTGQNNNLSKEALKDILFPFPKPAEQQKIASCLSSIDEVITGEQQKLELLKQHKKGLLQNLFPQEGETLPKLRFKEFENSGEWVEFSLNEVTPAIFDGTHQTPTYTENGIPFFSVENIISGKTNKFISREDYLLATSKNKPEKGDIIITRIGNIGTSKVIDWDYEFSVYVTLAILKKSPSFNSYYLHGYFQSSRYQKEILSKSLLNAVPCKINMDELRKTKILLPPDKGKNEQQKIASCLSSLDDLITAQTQKIEQLQRHKKGLLQGLFPNMNEQHG